MSALLPSELARLVLGYLKDENCDAAYEEFLHASIHLEECRGRDFFTRIMGLSLTDMINDYCAIQSYVLNYKCDEMFKKKISRSYSLLDKIVILIENCIPCNNCLNKTSRHGFPVMFESQNLKYFKKAHTRRNSCDSISTAISEVSHKCYKHSPAKNSTHSSVNRNYPNSVECPVQGASLADVPGNKNDFNPKEPYHNRNLSGEDDEFIPENMSNSQKKLDKTVNNRDDLLKPPDKKSPENKIDFRHALGLIKQTDLVDIHKTPIVRKSNKPKSITPKRGIHTTDSFPTDALNVTTITNALLDFPELHEKIADNINQLIRSQKLPVDLDISPNRLKLDTPLKESNNDVVAIDEDSQQMSGVIKAIVEKTEKDPLFDQLLNDVLAASLELMSGSDSDILSRAGTSPLIDSPNSSSNSYEHNFVPTDNAVKQRPRLQKPASGDTKTPAKTDNLKNHNFDLKAPSTYTVAQSKRYPRNPRGGKKMDLLRENYDPTNIEEGEIPSLAIPTENNSSVSTQQDKNIIILSNERLQTRAWNPDKKTDNHTDQNVMFEQSGNISQNMITLQSTPAKNSVLSRSNATPGFADINAANLRIPTGLIKTNDNPTMNNDGANGNAPLVICPFNPDAPINTKIDVSDGIHQSSGFFPNVYRNVESVKHKVMSGKPPNIVISSNRTVTLDTLGNSAKNESLYSEMEIMKMPTIIMLKPTDNNPIDLTGLNTEKTHTESDLSTILIAKNINDNEIYGINNSDNTVSKPRLSNLFPKIEKPGDIYSLFNYSAPKYQLKIVDSKDLNVYPDGSSEVLANTDTSVPYVLSNIHDVSVNDAKMNPIKDKDYVKLNIIDHAGEFIDIMQDNTDVEHVDSTTITKVSNDASDCGESKLKTPPHCTSKSTSRSTPSKRYSHVRVLDFNTPSNSIKRKALTSPKKVNTNTNDTPTTKQTKFHNVKSCLFSPVLEESNASKYSGVKDKLNPDIIDFVSDNKLIITQSVKKIECTTRINIANQDNTFENSDKISKITDKSNIKPVIPFKKSWDQDLRLITGYQLENFSEESNEKPSKTSKESISKKKLSQTLKDNQRVKESSKENQRAKKPSQISKDNRRIKKSPQTTKANQRVVKSKYKTCDKIAIEAKMLEDALLDRSLGSDARANVTPEEIKSKKTDSNANLSMSNSLTLVANDLELSTNTTSDDILNCSQNTIVNTSSIQNKISNEDLKSSPRKKYTKNGSQKKISPVSLKKNNPIQNFKYKRQTYLGLEKYSKLNIDISKENAVPLGKSKKGAKTKARTFKVKIGSYTDSKRNGSEDLSHSAKNLNKSGATDNSRSSESATNKSEAECEIPQSTHITPELPREFRSNPVNVRCNLGPLMETPFKSSLMDFSMATPRFLSPGQNSDPISTIKSLGFPTPNFNVTPVTCSKLSGVEGTPESSCSKPAGYSSCGSYYKPDEVDDLDIMNKSIKKKKLSSNHVKHKKQDNVKSTMTRVLRPRRKPSMRISKSPINQKKGKTIKLTEKNKSHNDSSFSNKSYDSGDFSYTTDNSDSNDAFRESENKSFSKSKKNNFTASTPFDNASKKECSKVESYKLSDSPSYTILQQKLLLEEKRLRVISKISKPEEKSKPIKVLKSRNGIKKSDLFLGKSRKKIQKNKQPLSVSFSIKDEPDKKQSSSKENHDDLIPVSKSSRRKSSTPRKLEKIQFNSENLLQPKIQYKNDVPRSANAECSKNSETKVKFANNGDDDKPSQKSIDNTVVDKTDDLEIELNRIHNEDETKLRLSNKKSDFRKNLENQGFDPEYVKKWEKGLTDYRSCEDSFESDHVSEIIKKSKVDDSTVSKIDPVTTETPSEIIPANEDAEKTIAADTVDSEPEDFMFFVWNEYDCNQSSSNFLNISYDSTSRKKRKANKNPLFMNCDIDNYKVNVNIFNTLLGRAEDRVIRASLFDCTLDISPEVKSKSRKKYPSKKDPVKEKKKPKPEEKKNIRTLHIDEMSKSSKESLSPNKVVMLNDDHANSDSETSTAIKNLLIDYGGSHKFPSPNVYSASKNKEADLVVTFDNSESMQSDVESRRVSLLKGDVQSSKLEDDDLMSFVVTGCSSPSKEQDVVEKRKRIDDDLSDFSAKKIKKSIDNLMKTLDIHQVLDQLHGPEDKTENTTSDLLDILK